MKARAYQQVDVFGSAPYLGNPVAVVARRLYPDLSVLFVYQEAYHRSNYSRPTRR